MKKRISAAVLVAMAVCALLVSCSSVKDTKPQKPDLSGTINIADENSASGDETGKTTSESTAGNSSDAQTDRQTVTTEEPLSEETTRNPLPQTLPSGGIDHDNAIVQTAEALVGIPFAENCATPDDGFDNSGFIYYVLRENGFINCPRLVRDQSVMGENIGYSELKSGDLAFFTNGEGTADFGGIYIGDGKMIFSPMPGQNVREADITTSYWQNCFVTGVRLS